MLAHAAHGTSSSQSPPMLLLLPSDCKQIVWSFLDARDLCRAAQVARYAERGVELAPIWQRCLQQLHHQEKTRWTTHKVPIECGLRRQGGSRDLTASVQESRGLQALWQAKDVEDGDATAPADAAAPSPSWRKLYQQLFVSIKAFDGADVAFQVAKQEIQELKRARGELKELVQASKQRNQSEKYLRRVQMSCARWMNRSSRRQTAAKHLRSAQLTSLSRSEVTEELQRVETSLQVQSKQLFTLRSQYQKSLHRMTVELTKHAPLLSRRPPSSMS
ncbi:TPA: hypothetical protein N0F65_011101 [Lagenidium giganteum]|uniref:F-box domain-containing protein n=1 Tax=Lagenidium giganteum TaxID=4803 RepID=A0AAV2ZC31_9STRA|nr:TPA: hypothetical protein N0F65_011101 [Lagenidium giganteum]